MCVGEGGHGVWMERLTDRLAHRQRETERKRAADKTTPHRLPLPTPLDVAILPHCFKNHNHFAVLRMIIGSSSLSLLW